MHGDSQSTTGDEEHELHPGDFQQECNFSGFDPNVCDLGNLGHLFHPAAE